jgi:hypothetical protein
MLACKSFEGMCVSKLRRRCLTKSQALPAESNPDDSRLLKQGKYQRKKPIQSHSTLFGSSMLRRVGAVFLHLRPKLPRICQEFFVLKRRRGDPSSHTPYFARNHASRGRLIFSGALFPPAVRLLPGGGRRERECSRHACVCGRETWQSLGVPIWHPRWPCPRRAQ